MKLDPALEKKILAMEGTTVKGPAPEEDDAEPYTGLLEFDCTWIQPMWIQYTISVQTASETNKRCWQGRSGRTKKAWSAVSQSVGTRLDLLTPFAMHYHRGGKVYVRFTRYGPRALDRSNVPSATKAVEDALAFMMGADDGDARWVPCWEQIKSKLHGVKIELRDQPFE
jgi:hypothetical protein